MYNHNLCCTRNKCQTAGKAFNTYVIITVIIIIYIKCITIDYVFPKHQIHIYCIPDKMKYLHTDIMSVQILFNQFNQSKKHWEILYMNPRHFTTALFFPPFDYIRLLRSIVKRPCIDLFITFIFNVNDAYAFEAIKYWRASIFSGDCAWYFEIRIQTTVVNAYVYHFNRAARQRQRQHKLAGNTKYCIVIPNTLYFFSNNALEFKLRL